jgi:putative hydrolase of the HAD superfamily
MPSALLFDVGDVLLESSWVVLDALEQRTGRRIHGRGPLDPAGDPAWQRCLAGEIEVDEYWNQLANSGGYADRIELWRALSDELGHDVFADDALALVDEARAAGIKVGILSNDLYRASGRDWVESRPELSGFDALVDCTEFGERKPAPAPYLKAAADLGVPPNEIVFLDDTPYCIEGARAVGMLAVPVDPLARSHAFAVARRLVGLTPPRPADALVAEVERTYRAGDLGAMSALLHPDVVIYWDGHKVAEGLVPAGHFYQRLFGDVADAQITTRAVDGDTVAIEWESATAETPRVAAELWTLRYGLLIEVRGYEHRVENRGGSR